MSNSSEPSIDIRCIIIDSIELICYKIIESITTSSKHKVESLFVQLEYLLNKIETDDFHGRLACRLDFTYLVRKVCQSSSAKNEEVKDQSSQKTKLAETFKDGSDDSNQMLSAYSPEDWENLVSDLKNLQRRLQRKDARHIIIPEKFKGLSDNHTQDQTDYIPTLHEASSKDERNPEYSPENFDAILLEISFYHALSHIRYSVSSLNIKSTSQNISLFHDFVAKSEFDAEKLDLLKCFFEDVDQTKLIPISDIQQILKKNSIYSIKRFQDLLMEFIQKWHLKNLPTPKFMELNYEGAFIKNTKPHPSEQDNKINDVSVADNDEKSDDDDDFVDKLKEFREKLNETGGKDPLEEIIGTTQKSTQKITQLAVNKDVARKRKEVQIQFSDSDEEISSPDDTTNTNINTNKSKDTSNEAAPLKKRRRFMQDEKDAIKEGVAIFGQGNWSKIKSEYPALWSRTNVNIKDCYRTMCRNGEI